MEKYALVTGGAIRVGKAICERLAAEGYGIIALYNSSQKEAEELKGSIRNCSIYQCDISNIKSIRLTLKEVFSEVKNITLLVNNASIFEKYNFEETTEEIFDRHFDINLKAPFFITQSYYEYCKENKIDGHIINILDSYISTNNGAYFAYLLSKKSLHDFTMMSAKNLAPDVRVNAVSLDSVLPSKYWNEESMKKKMAELPLKSPIKLDDITSAICYLDNAKNVTGQNIFVDSGHHLI